MGINYIFGSSGEEQPLYSSGFSFQVEKLDLEQLYPKLTPNLAFLLLLSTEPLSAISFSSSACASTFLVWVPCHPLFLLPVIFFP